MFVTSFSLRYPTIPVIFTAPSSRARQKEPLSGQIGDTVETQTHTTEDRRKFARGQFQNVVDLGFNKRTASKMMRTVGPSHLQECADWVVANWWLMRDHLTKKEERVTNDLIRAKLFEVCDRVIGCAGEVHTVKGDRASLNFCGLSCPSIDHDEMVRILKGAVVALEGMPLKTKTK